MLNACKHHALSQTLPGNLCFKALLTAGCGSQDNSGTQFRHPIGAMIMSQKLLKQNLVQHEPAHPFAQQIATTQR